MLLILPELLVKPKLGLGADGMGWRRSPPGNEGDLGVCSGALLKEGVAGVYRSRVGGIGNVVDRRACAMPGVEVLLAHRQ